MVHVPTPEEEDHRRVCRELKSLIGERIRHVNRVKGVLFAQGIGDYEPRNKDRRRRPEELRTGDGRTLPHLKALVLRELDIIELLNRQIETVKMERDALLADAPQTSLWPAVLSCVPFAFPSAVSPVLSISKCSGPVEPRSGMSTANAFWRRHRMLKSGTTQCRPISCKRLSTKPAAWRRARPNSTFIVRQT